MPHTRNARSRATLTLVTDGFIPAEAHQPWCDPAEHSGGACRSTPTQLKFGHRGTQPGAVTAASMQLTTAAGPDGASVRALLTLNTAVFELDIEQIAAVGAGFESLVLTQVGLADQGRMLAAKAAQLAAPSTYPALAGV